MKAKQSIPILLIAMILILSLTLTLATLGVTGADLTGTTPEGFVYEQVSSTKMKITGYTGSGGQIQIPVDIHEIPVAVIGTNAFSGNTAITRVTLCDSVLTIEAGAFQNCTELTEISFGNSLTTIGEEAFRDCPKLLAVILPDTVTSVGKWAFHGCSSVETVELSNSLALISEGSFEELTSLQRMVIPASVKEIGVWAFAGNTAMTQVDMSTSTVTKIGYCAFKSCTVLGSITFPDSLKDLGREALLDCTALSSVKILGHGIETVGSNAFNGVTPTYESKHPVCGMTCVCGSNHSSLTYTAWTDATALPSSAGNYALLTDVTISDTWKGWSGTMNICLNGHTITTEGGRVMEVASGSILNIADCRAECGSITGGRITDVGGGIMNEGTFNLYGGKIRGNKTEFYDHDFDKHGGGVYNGNIFNMYGGEITANTADRNGGGGLYNVGTCNIYGGSISSNTATHGGGGIYNTGTLYLRGGSISDNDTGDENNSTPGGGIANVGGTLIMSGGTVFGNCALTDGGGIYSSGGALTVSGGTISGNTAQKGGGVFVQIDTTIAQLSGGQITSNQASAWGGGVCVSRGFSSQAADAAFGNQLKVTDNTQGGMPNNIFVEDNAVVQADTSGIDHQPKYFSFDDAHNKKITLTGGTGEGLYLDETGYHLHALDATTAQFHQITKSYLASAATLSQVGTDGAPDQYYVSCTCGDNLEETFLAYLHPLCGAACAHTPAHDAVQFAVWEQTDSMPSTAGSYMLWSHVSMSGNWTVSGDTILCLGGYTLDMGNAYVSIPSGASLTICDCVGTGKITSACETNGTVKLTSGTLVLEGGSIVNTATSNNYSHAVFNEAGQVTVKGGSLNSTADAGLWNISKAGTGATAILSGGIVQGIDGIYNRGSTVQISGDAQIIGTKEAGLTNYGTMTMTGGSISGADHGIWNGVFDTSAIGHATISGGTITGPLGIYNSTNANCILKLTGNTTVIGTNQFGVKNYGTFHVSDTVSISGQKYGIEMYESNLYLSGTPNISGGTASIHDHTQHCYHDGGIYAADETGAVPYDGASLTIEIYLWEFDEGEAIVRAVNENNNYKFSITSSEATLILGSGANADDLVLHTHSYVGCYETSSGQHYYACSCGIRGVDSEDHIYDLSTGACPCGAWGYKVWVGPIYVTDVNKNDVLGTGDAGATVRYDPDTNTLTLHGAALTESYCDQWGCYDNIYASGNLNILVIGNNTITAVDSSGNEYAYGIVSDGELVMNYAEGATLSIVSECGGLAAEMKLVINGGSTVVQCGYAGIWSNGEVIFNGGSFKTSGGERGIYGTLLTVHGGTIHTDSERYGIYVDWILINGGTVEGTGGRYGIRSDVIEICGGTVKGTGDRCGIDTGSMEVSGGNVFATGGYGIMTETLTVTGGTVKAVGETEAVWVIYEPDPDDFGACYVLGSVQQNAENSDYAEGVLWLEDIGTGEYYAALGAEAVKTLLICKHEPGEPTAVDSHTHQRVCLHCGLTVTVEAHIPNIPEATVESAQICTVCQYEMEAKIHRHIFDREVAEEPYLSSPASCVAKALYYKSCACGAKGTEHFEFGSIGHAKSTFTYVENTDGATHVKKHECCGIVSVGAEPHNYGSDRRCVCGAERPIAIHIENGTVEGMEGSNITVDPNGTVTVKANAAPEGKIFKGWSVDGTIVSTEESYTFQATADTKLTAVYEDISAAPEEPRGLSGGVIVAIVISCVAVLGGGGFALYWFVIRRKKMIRF